MDAKSRASFINSVAAGNNIPCPQCGASNKEDSKFCVSCGAEIVSAQKAETSTPAFETVKESAVPVKAVKYVEPTSVFAQGLPEWSIEPPQVLVRRH